MEKTDRSETPDDATAAIAAIVLCRQDSCIYCIAVFLFSFNFWMIERSQSDPSPPECKSLPIYPRADQTDKSATPLHRCHESS